MISRVAISAFLTFSIVGFVLQQWVNLSRKRNPLIRRVNAGIHRSHEMSAAPIRRLKFRERGVVVRELAIGVLVGVVVGCGSDGSEEQAAITRTLSVAAAQADGLLRLSMVRTVRML
jgi:hypothetical protein